jgi:hypothetical protein
MKWKKRDNIFRTFIEFWLNGMWKATHRRKKNFPSYCLDFGWGTGCLMRDDGAFVGFDF